MLLQYTAIFISPPQIPSSFPQKATNSPKIVVTLLEFTMSFISIRSALSAAVLCLLALSTICVYNASKLGSTFDNISLVSEVENHLLRDETHQVLQNTLADTEWRKHAIERLASFLRIKTVSREAGVVEYPDNFLKLHRKFEEWYPELHSTPQVTREVVNKHALLYTWQGTDASLKPYLLMSHQDVVPTDDGLDAWDYEPFAGLQDDEFLMGRGALDVKSGVGCILEAANLLAKNGFKPRRTMLMIFGSDEEVGGSTTVAAMELLKSRGITELEFVLDEGGSMTKGVLDIIPDKNKHVAFIGLAEKGYIGISMRVRASGGHSSMPPIKTPTGTLARAIVAIEDNPMPPRWDNMNALMKTVGHMLPFTTRALLGNTWLFEGMLDSKIRKSPQGNAFIRTVLSTTQLFGSAKVNVLPREARAIANARIMPGDSSQDVFDHVKRVVNDDDVEITRLHESPSEPTPMSPTDTRQFAALAQTISEVFPQSIVAGGVCPGMTDARHFVGLTKNIYRFMAYTLEGTDLQRIHGINERIRKTDYINMIDFMLRFVRNVDTHLAPAK
jgi:carboxypeptidase PM20D1